MSMSDKSFSWQSWVPNNFKSEDILPSIAQLPQVQKNESGLQAEPSQAELLRIRQQVEIEARAQGERRGYDEGKQKGYQEGLELGRKDALEQVEKENQETQKLISARFNTLFESVQSSLEDLDSVISARLVQLALTAARSIVGDNLKYDSAMLLENIKQQLSGDFLLKGNLQLWVSGEDYAIINDNIMPDLVAKGWELHREPLMLPGGFRITSTEGEIDSTLSTRWDELCERLRESTQS